MIFWNPLCSNLQQLQFVICCHCYGSSSTPYISWHWIKDLCYRCIISVLSSVYVFLLQKLNYFIVKLVTIRTQVLSTIKFHLQDLRSYGNIKYPWRMAGSQITVWFHFSVVIFIILKSGFCGWYFEHCTYHIWVGKFAADFRDLSIIIFVFVNQCQGFILPFFAFLCSSNSGTFLILNDFVLRIASYHQWLGKLWTFKNFHYFKLYCV